ncbi:hypothetical protein NLJ89_g10437 [Agrocybe chaxingu]|uniref:Uncharacterized protein n=1 Tax=Agrocybe chaxingu TaxID=84603 RepID=A0A9W8JRS8_9AGAR|nr:hypothetical protein NLJ89_g10437 [Agrocybe chaxingu]
MALGDFYDTPSGSCDWHKHLADESPYATGTFKRAPSETSSDEGYQSDPTLATDTDDKIQDFLLERFRRREQLRIRHEADRNALEARLQEEQEEEETRLMEEFARHQDSLEDERVRLFRVCFEEEKTLWEQERQRQRDVFEQEKADWRARYGHTIDLVEARKQWEAERSDDWKKLEAERAKWLAEVKKQTAAIRQDSLKLEKLLKNKKKFQDEIDTLKEQLESERQRTLHSDDEPALRDRLRDSVIAELQYAMAFNVNELMDQMSMRNELMENENEKEWQDAVHHSPKMATANLFNNSSGSQKGKSYTIVSREFLKLHSRCNKSFGLPQENADVADRIRLRNLVDRSQMFLANQAGLETIGEETESMAWRRCLNGVPAGPQRLAHARKLLECRSKNDRVRRFLDNTKALEVVCDFPSRLRQAGNDTHGSFPRSHYLESVKSSWKYDARIEAKSLEALVDLIAPP